MRLQRVGLGMLGKQTEERLVRSVGAIESRKEVVEVAAEDGGVREKRARGGRFLTGMEKSESSSSSKKGEELLQEKEKSKSGQLGDGSSESDVFSNEQGGSDKSSIISYVSSEFG